MDASFSEVACEDVASAPEAPAHGRGGDEGGAAAFAGLDDFCIGSQLGEAQRQLSEAGEALRREKLDPAAAQLVETLLQNAGRQVCRIAVIGQIKAGKSTFVNSLAQRPYILPTDVNPWTAVITKLHFGEPDGRTSGALFHFFSPGEWRRLVCGGGRSRELAERAGGAQQLDHLREGLGDIERRAARRLGAGFSNHLGKHHLFNSITPEVVERYVAAGPNPGAGTPAPGRGSSGAGQFSDITKTAELFFDARPFGCPSVVIDTPGANDPHLVRDEITLQHLGAADIYVVVLTAQQPLSTADLDLLRTLRGLHQERIAVLVNRIDGLADIVQDSRDVVDYVNARLKREFPGCDIPVAAGSALWSRYALGLASGAASGASPLTPEFFEYARALGAISESAVDAWGRGMLPAGEMARALYAASGVRDVAEIVSQLMLKSSAARNVARAARALLSVSSGARAALKAETSIRAVLIKDVESGSTPGAEVEEERRKRLDHLKTVAGRLGDLLDEAELRFQAAKQSAVDGVRDTLDEAIARAAAKEIDAYRAMAASGGRMEDWKCDVLEIRRQIAEAFLQAFAGAAQKIATVRDDSAFGLDALLRDAAGSGEPAVGDFFPQVDGPVQAPSLAPLSQAVIFDRAQEARAPLWLADESLDDNARRIEGLIRSEFEFAARELVEASDECLDNEIIQHVRVWAAVAPQVIKSLIQNESRLSKAYERLRVEGAERLLPALQRVKDEYAAQCERLARIDELDRDLNGVAERALGFVSEGRQDCGGEQAA